MNSLELKHIAPYLPYGLKCHAMGEYVDNDHPDGSEPKLLTVSGTYTDTLGNRYIEAMHDGGKYEISFNTDFFPILRPLSDLTEEIYGKIDLVELAVMASDYNGYSFEFEDISNFDLRVNSRNGYVFEYNGFEFHLINFYDNLIGVNQIELFQYLFEKHYDVFGLIGLGLAVDVNKIQSHE